MRGIKAVVALAILLFASGVAQIRAEEAKPKPQTKCPVSGKKINEKQYVDAAGKRIYACCAGCTGKIKADPEKYIKKIVDNGENPEIRLALCTKCGEIKGTAKCCAPNAAECSKCNLFKGSPGCCIMQKGSKKETILCPSCGEIKGSSKCCVKNAKKCPKCKLDAGAPGCCKLGDFIGKSSKSGAGKGSTTKKAGTTGGSRSKGGSSTK